ncbi:helix-turn-helix transcriptional regulator [Adlercreutzia sp. R25]|uniref:helix-turn-helix transcriptional regulator n=1 Tax=Adlercreutzia shanghongiae TaxID=3111773 RepID=UPI002DB9BCB1|nr:helix-turn-helix transcriptional regulator [Adlercreutzia sp. R25]MEC4273642.1 helix-turn-helix transcriptional regulator [Adlercreutzia sp. R25]
MGDIDVRKIMAAACAGFGIVLACSPLSSAVEVLVSLGLLTTGIGGWVDQAVFAVFFIASMGILGARGRSGLRLAAESGPGTIATLLLIEGGIVLVGAAELFSGERLAVDVVLTLGAALRGVGVCILLAAWMELFALLSPYVRHFGTSLTAALGFSAVLALCLGALAVASSGAVVAAMAVLPVADVVLLRWCASPLSAQLQERSYPKGRVNMPAPTLLIIGSFGVSLGGTWVVVFAVPNSMTALCTCLGFLAASAALMVVTRTVARSREYSFGMLLRTATFVSAAAFLALPVLWPSWPDAAVFVMGCAWAVQVFAFAFMPVQMIEKLPVGPMSLMAAGSRALGAGVVVASIVGGAVVAAFGPTTRALAAVSLIVCLQLLLSAMLMPPRAMDASALGIHSYMERETPLERLQRRCREVAGRCGLTDREAEVMLLLAQGLSRARIAEELVVSGETVKTHIKHIYEKLGVHSLREMTTLIETGKRTEDEAADQRLPH